MSKTTIIPIGPYHPLQEEPEFFKLHVEGERVVHVDIEVGYNHFISRPPGFCKDFSIGIEDHGISGAYFVVVDANTVGVE